MQNLKPHLWKPPHPLISHPWLSSLSTGGLYLPDQYQHRELMDPSLNISTVREIWKESNEKHWLPVQGNSMEPLLHEGDRILISHDLSTVRRGDILVFQQSEGLVAHRVVRMKEQTDNTPAFITKGDNCTFFDAPISGEVILGKVNLIYKKGREFDLTTPGYRLRNIFLAQYHFLYGQLLQTLRLIKHKFQ